MSTAPLSEPNALPFHLWHTALEVIGVDMHNIFQRKVSVGAQPIQSVPLGVDNRWHNHESPTHPRVTHLAYSHGSAGENDPRVWLGLRATNNATTCKERHSAVRLDRQSEEWIARVGTDIDST